MDQVSRGHKSPSPSRIMMLRLSSFQASVFVPALISGYVWHGPRSAAVSDSESPAVCLWVCTTVCVTVTTARRSRESFCCLELQPERAQAAAPPHRPDGGKLERDRTWPGHCYCATCGQCSSCAPAAEGHGHGHGHPGHGAAGSGCLRTPGTTSSQVSRGGGSQAAKSLSTKFSIDSSHPTRTSAVGP
eukprot:3197014-Rhodomonas_salina.1